MSQKNAISPIREEDYPEWYQQVIKAADLAEHSPVRGCMVIKPWGFRLWENMKAVLDSFFKEEGYENAYFPLFIPLSYLEKEAEHVEGFAKECAVVTHHRLEPGKDGKLVPAGPLEEPLIVRPTSEMIIGEMYAKWIESHRDLPLLINQWCNVVRWEMRTRLFLRTAEFLWQEGHTAHATEQEAREETLKMFGVYNRFCHDYLALPVIPGEKTESERFPGAVQTFTIEAMMQDRKALQGGTSHFLGQNFSKAANIRFTDVDGELKHVWTTSFGFTTRMIGSLIMTHSDDDGLILPPRIAPAHLVIIPILHKEETKEQVLAACDAFAKELKQVQYDGKPLEVVVDKREMRGGEKSWHWIKKGIPMRLEVGPKDIENDEYGLKMRHKPHREVKKYSKDALLKNIAQDLEEMQNEIYHKAVAFRDQHTVKIDSKEEFTAFFTPKNRDKPEIHGGFALCHWNGSAEVEEKVKKELNVTIRCIPLDSPEEEGKCIFTGEKSAKRVIFAKSY